jgi:hypothetical protein
MPVSKAFQHPIFEHANSPHKLFFHGWASAVEIGEFISTSFCCVLSLGGLPWAQLPAQLRPTLRGSAPAPALLGRACSSASLLGPIGLRWPHWAQLGWRGSAELSRAERRAPRWSRTKRGRWAHFGSIGPSGLAGLS